MSPVTPGRNDLWGGLLLAIGVVLAVTAFAGVSLFQIGLTAFFTWLALARKQGWAWIPAAIFGFQVAQDLLDGVGGSLFFPLMVVAAGVLMLSRDRLSKNATIGILLLLAVVGIASGNRDRADAPEPGPPAESAEPAPPAEPEIPDNTHPYDLDGRRLVIQAGSTDLVLTRARGSQVLIGIESGFDISEEGGLARLQIPEGEAPLEIAIPAEADVAVQTVSGDVEAEVGAFKLAVDTISGDVEVELIGDHAVTAESPEGRITASDLEDLDPSPEFLRGAAGGSPVRLRSDSGQIVVSQA